MVNAEDVAGLYLFSLMPVVEVMLTGLLCLAAGSGNHRYFMAYLFFLLCMICWMIYGCISCKTPTPESPNRASISTSLVDVLFPPPDWRVHCATTYAKDGFWLYLTQIASCSPWIFWMFLNSIFHFMWVAVLIMCQLYQVWRPDYQLSFS